MKKVPYTMSGKRGDTVWQRARYGQIHYKAFIPANPRTYAQRFVRRNFALTATGWRFLSEDERVAWCVRAKSKKSRRRLGKSWPLKGFYYYMRENVILANRGLPPLALPPADPWAPRTELPPLTRTLSPQELKLLLDSPKTPPESHGRAPP